MKKSYLAIVQEADISVPAPRPKVLLSPSRPLLGVLLAYAGQVFDATFWANTGFILVVGVPAALEQDAQLMLRVKEGDACSFELLLGKYRRPVVNYLYRMVRNQGVAEELAQEVFLRVYRARDRYEPTAKFTTWLFRITTHLALNALRDGKAERYDTSLDGNGDAQQTWDVPDRRANREQQMVAASRLDAVRRAIAELPEKQRAAVLMHKYQELDYTQIAGALECSVPAVKSLLFRAYETLRGKLIHLSADEGQHAPLDRTRGFHDS